MRKKRFYFILGSENKSSKTYWCRIEIAFYWINGIHNLATCVQNKYSVVLIHLPCRIINGNV